MVDVDVVETDRLVTHARLTGCRIADFHFFPAHDFGATGLMNTNGKWHHDLLTLRNATV
jgi:hypothetical protein